MRRPVVITGGGTGGHIFPMLAIAEALQAQGIDAADLRYVGSRRGQESALLGGGPVSLTLLPGRGIRRSLSWRATRDNIGALAALISAASRAVIAVGRWRPSVVVSVGGYAAAATSAAAVLWRRPLVLVDLDATPSATHRILGTFATHRCVAFGHPSDHITVTGAPVRRDLADIDRSPEARERARRELDPPMDPRRRAVVVMTGSLGARRVNDAVSDLATRWRDREDLALIQITGRRDHAEFVSRAVEGALDYRVIEFGDMATWWAVADVAVCRAGAMTVAELTLLALPAVLVPLPGAPGDHQAHNARALADEGAALVVQDAECDAETLAGALESLLEGAVAAEMSRASAGLAHPHAAEEIARVVRRVGGLG